MICEGWKKGRRGREALRDWLAGIRDFDGATGRISFLPDRRVNGEMVLMKIGSQGKIVPLEADDLPDFSSLEELDQAGQEEAFEVGFEAEEAPPAVDRTE